MSLRILFDSQTTLQPCVNANALLHSFWVPKIISISAQITCSWPSINELRREWSQSNDAAMLELFVELWVLLRWHQQSRHVYHSRHWVTDETRWPAPTPRRERAHRNGDSSLSPPQQSPELLLQTQDEYCVPESWHVRDDFFTKQLAGLPWTTNKRRGNLQLLRGLPGSTLRQHSNLWNRMQRGILGKCERCLPWKEQLANGISLACRHKFWIWNGSRPAWKPTCRYPAHLMLDVRYVFVSVCVCVHKNLHSFNTIGYKWWGI